MRNLIAVALWLAGCGGAPPDVAWPPSAQVDLPSELRITELEELAERAAVEPDLPDELEAADHPGIRVREIEVGGLYALEVVLGVAELDDELPTIWAMHGRGDRPIVPGGPFLNTSRPIRVILPRAPTPLGDGFTWLSVRAAEGRPAEFEASLRERAAQLAGAIRERMAQVPHLGRPIVTGFSQGGHLAYALALLYPELVSFALPNAGWVPPGLAPAANDPRRFPPMRATHGGADLVVPFAPAAALVEHLRAAGLDAELRAFDGIAHTMSPEMNEAFHAWLEDALRHGAPRVAQASDVSPEDELEGHPGDGAATEGEPGDEEGGEERGEESDAAVEDDTHASVRRGILRHAA